MLFSISFDLTESIYQFPYLSNSSLLKNIVGKLYMSTKCDFERNDWLVIKLLSSSLLFHSILLVAVFTVL